MIKMTFNRTSVDKAGSQEETTNIIKIKRINEDLSLQRQEKLVATIATMNRTRPKTIAVSRAYFGAQNV